MKKEVVATLRHARISPQKARLVIDQIRGLSVEEASKRLSFSVKKAAGLIHKLLKSAIANAENNHGLDIDELVVAKAYVNEAPNLKRFRARAKGRGNRITKRNSHIHIELLPLLGEH